MAILHNRKNSSVTLHFVANATITVAGNSSVSNVAIGDEVLTGGVINQVWWGGAGAANTLVTIKRGSNTVGVYDSTGWHDYAGNGCALNKDAAGTLVVEFSGSTAGFVMIDLQKVGTFVTTY